MLKDSDFKVWIPDIEEVAEFLEAVKRAGHGQDPVEARSMLPKSQLMSYTVFSEFSDQWKTRSVHRDIPQTKVARDDGRVLQLQLD
jgi:hypothetical protein